MTSRTWGVRSRVAFVVALAGLLTVPALTARATAPCTEDMSAAGGDWPTYGQNLLGQQRQDAEHTIGVENAGHLQQVWKLGILGGSGQEPLDTGYQSPPPIVSGGCVFLNTGGHIVAYALEAPDADGSPRIVWTSPDTYTDPRTHDQISLDTSETFAVTVETTDGITRVHLGLRNGGVPRAAALDVRDGHVLWVSDPVSFTPQLGQTPGANQESSAIVADGIQALFTTGPDFDPSARQGYALIDARTGRILHQQTTLSPDALAHGYSGGGVWGTPTVDLESHRLFVGTSNPESKTKESDYDDSIIVIDLDRAHGQSFGTIIDSFKGTPDSLTGYQNPVCQSFGDTAWVNGGVYGSSPTCGQLDVDFGIGPTLWRSSGGHVLGAATQKSGWLHIYDFDATGGEPREVFSQQLWVSMSFLGGNLARSATDGETLYVAANPGLLHAYDIRDPNHITEKWFRPLTGLPQKGGNVALANGVVYYVDEPGLKAWSASDGLPIPIPGATQPASSIGCGVAIAGGYIVANHYGVIAAYKLPSS